MRYEQLVKGKIHKFVRTPHPYESCARSGHKGALIVRTTVPCSGITVLVCTECGLNA